MILFTHNIRILHKTKEVQNIIIIESNKIPSIFKNKKIIINIFFKGNNIIMRSTTVHVSPSSGYETSHPSNMFLFCRAVLSRRFRSFRDI